MDPAWRRGYRRLADFGLSFDLLVWPWQLTEAARFVAGVPDVPVMVEHMGCPVDRSPDGVRVWRDGLRAIAAVGHAYLKLSAMSLLGPSWTVDDVRPFILDAIDAFGPDRCMFGSNFPVERLSCGYPRLWTAYAEVTAGFTEAERRDLFAGTAARAYRIGG